MRFKKHDKYHKKYCPLFCLDYCGFVFEKTRKSILLKVKYFSGCVMVVLGGGGANALMCFFLHGMGLGIRSKFLCLPLPFEIYPQTAVWGEEPPLYVVQVVVVLEQQPDPVPVPGEGIHNWSSNSRNLQHFRFGICTRVTVNQFT